jgi:integrase/recombinase XerD
MTRRPPIADWPERDRALWEKGVEPKGLFEGGGVGAGWSDASRFKTARGYRYWLLWLTAHGLCDRNLSAADRVTRERVAAYVAELKPTRAPYTVLCRIRELYDAMRVMAPETDWDWLSELHCTLSAGVRPVRDKLPRLRPIGELDDLGQRLMDEAESAAEWSARRRAVLFRDALIIALLAYRPVRLKNLAMMRLGRHLVKVGGSWQMLFGAHETKTHVLYEARVPSTLAPRLERYLDAHRPVLLRGKCVHDRANNMPLSEGETSIRPKVDAVWVSEVGTQIEQGALTHRIVKHTKAAFGRSVSPHMFRDCVATSIALDNPKHVGDASLVLGHAGHRMTEKHYNHARSLEASRRHATTIARLRETLNAGRKG